MADLKSGALVIGPVLIVIGAVILNFSKKEKTEKLGRSIIFAGIALVGFSLL